MAAALPFVNGGAAGMIATSIIQPVDMVKVCGLLSRSFVSWDGTTVGRCGAAALGLRGWRFRTGPTCANDHCPIQLCCVCGVCCTNHR